MPEEFMKILRRSFASVTSSTIALALLVGVAACSAPESPSRGSTAQERDDDLRGISRDEAVSELRQIGDAIRAYYGPLEYKRARFGFDLDKELAEAIAETEQSSTEGDRVRAVKRLLAKLRDGHVGYEFPIRGDGSVTSYAPLVVEPIEGSFVVSLVRPALSGQVARGDVLVSVDGKSTDELERLLTPLVQNATEESTRQFVALGMRKREFFFPNELRPQGATAHFVFRRADGTEYAVDVPWQRLDAGLDSLTSLSAIQASASVASAARPQMLPDDAGFSRRTASLLQTASLVTRGSSEPIFFSEKLKSDFNIVEVKPKPQSLAALGVAVPSMNGGDGGSEDESPTLSMRAYKYAHKGKTVLLVRIPTFQLGDDRYAENIAWLGALLRDNMVAPTAGAALRDTPADVVVVDETHNGGGAIAYASALASLFATGPIPNIVQAHRADRKWLEGYNIFAARIVDFGQSSSQDVSAEHNAVVRRARGLESAIDASSWLAPFAPFVGGLARPNAPDTYASLVGGEMLTPDPAVRWTKPVLVLHDELSGSSADIFPALLQAGGVAKTFGMRTNGLGGSVEEVLTLPFSRAKLFLTRGLFAPYQADGTYDSADYIENNGVTPNFPYAHTLADFRAGFVKYVTAFSDVAVSLKRD